VREECVLGDRVSCTREPSSEANGFGFVRTAIVYRKLPQIGTVRSRRIEIGAKVRSTRATTGATRASERGAASKKSTTWSRSPTTTCNRKSCIMSRSRWALGQHRAGQKPRSAPGQVGLVGHTRIGEEPPWGAQSGSQVGVKEGERMFGTPAMPLDRRSASRRAAGGTGPSSSRPMRALKRTRGELAGAPSPGDDARTAPPSRSRSPSRALGLHTAFRVGWRWNSAPPADPARFIVSRPFPALRDSVSPRYAPADTEADAAHDLEERRRRWCTRVLFRATSGRGRRVGIENLIHRPDRAGAGRAARHGSDAGPVRRMFKEAGVV